MSEFAGTWALTRFALRRDRILIPAWVVVIVLIAVSSAQATVDLYPSAASRAQAAATVNDVPALVALYGRIWDPDSLGALSTMKLSAFGAALIGVLGIFLVIRHTRREEENGRLELLGATVVGRRAALAAALLVTVGTMVVIAVSTAVGMGATGLPLAGSWAFGLAWGAIGILFATVAAVVAQVTVSARAAIGGSLVVLAIAYILRAVGDVGGDAGSPGPATWLSPIGWGQQVRPFAGDRWWVLLLPLAASALLGAGAFALAARRDLGAGLLPDRAGPPVAPRWLGSPLALAWRLQRGLLFSWVVAYSLLGLVMGSISASVGSMLGSEQAREFITRLGGTEVLANAFLATVLAVIALSTAAFGISVSLRLRTEEESGGAELVLTGAVSRTAWLVSHTAIAIVGTVILSLVAGITAGAAAALHAGTEMGSILGGVLAYLPAVWTLTGLVVLLVGIAPRLAWLAWAALVAFLLAGELGPLLDLPAWVMDLSPFAHVPRLPGASMTWLPLLVLTAVAAALMVAGSVGFRRRDVPA